MLLVFCSSLFLLFQNTFTIDLCTQHRNCRDCIRDVNKCVWCDTHKLNDTKCKSDKENLENWCPNNIWNPRSTYNITKNKQFSSEIGRVVHIKPQQLKINIRPGDSIDFKFSFKTAQRYPVDLYFLLDGSSTMKDTKDDIVIQGENIYETIKTMTDNVHLGVGFFVDKNLLPFTNALNSKNTYSFRNRLKLVNNSDAFKKAITDMEFGYNYDEPESALDALAQILACKKQIGWRDESRKIIIVLTGASYHVAGDGMVGGVNKPYDGKCYTEDDIYTKEREMDYPSVGIINKLASEDEKIIIFAVDHNVLKFYNTTIYSIRGSKLVEYPGDGIVSILTSVYEDITQILKIKVNITKPEHRKYLDFSFSPDCYNSYNEYKGCNVKQNGEKEFTVTLKLLSFLEAKDLKMVINIEGIKEKLEVDIDVIEQCDCMRENNSKSCNHHGSLHCGTCECETNRYYGDSCQCEIINSDSNPEDETSCIANGTKTICNNRGSCSCGMCKCRNGYKGQFCECSDNSCERGANNELCSGPYNGDCDCGKCNCKSGWEGSTCACSTSKAKCISGDKSLCNNRGKCVCGECKCDSISDWDARTKEQADCTLFCPEDGSCYSRQCLNIAPIVLCYLNSNDCKHVENINITVVANLSIIQSQNWYHCSKVIVEVGCYTKFLYRYLTDSYGIEVAMEKEIDCVEANFLWGAICLITLIVIGVGTLIAWKIWTDRIDRLEYERIFQQAMKNSNIESEIFIAPTKLYKNPQYQDMQNNPKQHKHVNKNKNCSLFTFSNLSALVLPLTIKNIGMWNFRFDIERRQNCL